MPVLPATVKPEVRLPKTVTALEIVSEAPLVRVAPVKEFMFRVDAPVLEEMTRPP